eukprot:COSAG01_NODE_949_length_12505_cov_3.853539_5_plen_38_part_00
MLAMLFGRSETEGLTLPERSVLRVRGEIMGLIIMRTD